MQSVFMALNALESYIEIPNFMEFYNRRSQPDRPTFYVDQFWAAIFGHYVTALKQSNLFFGLMASSPRYWEPLESKFEDFYLFWTKEAGDLENGEQTVMLFEVRTPRYDNPEARLDRAMRRWFGIPPIDDTSPRVRRDRQGSFLPLYGMVSVGVTVRFYSLHGYNAPLREIRPKDDGSAWHLLHDHEEIHKIFKWLFAYFVRDAMAFESGRAVVEE